MLGDCTVCFIGGALSFWEKPSRPLQLNPAAWAGQIRKSYARSLSQKERGRERDYREEERERDSTSLPAAWGGRSAAAESSTYQPTPCCKQDAGAES